LDQSVEPIRLLASSTLLFVRTANGPIVAENASAALRGGGEKSFLDSMADGLQHALYALAR
jgi:hypothetical protein